jgi:hypothetical protein
MFGGCRYLGQGYLICYQHYQLQLERNHERAVGVKEPVTWCSMREKERERERKRIFMEIVVLFQHVKQLGVFSVQSDTVSFIGGLGLCEAT